MQILRPLSVTDESSEAMAKTQIKDPRVSLVEMLMVEEHQAYACELWRLEPLSRFSRERIPVTHRRTIPAATCMCPRFSQMCSTNRVTTSTWNNKPELFYCFVVNPDNSSFLQMWCLHTRCTCLQFHILDNKKWKKFIHIKSALDSSQKPGCRYLSQWDNMVSYKTSTCR